VGIGAGREIGMAIDEGNVPSALGILQGCIVAQHHRQARVPLVDKPVVTDGNEVVVGVVSFRNP
jgi:hypothetical protein